MIEEQPQKPTHSPTVFQYTTEYEIFSLDISLRSQTNRIAMSSFNPYGTNMVSIIELNQHSQIEECLTFEHRYPPTSIQFVPDEVGNMPDLLATSADKINIWRIGDNGDVFHQKSLQSGEIFNAPFPSFDWNPHEPQILAAVSIDATCSIWNVQTGKICYQFIPHQCEEVYDIHFSSDTNIFCTVGSDQTLRQFDFRQIQAGSLLYKSKNPLLKLRCNRFGQNPHQIAVIEEDMPKVSIIDDRRPSMPVLVLDCHKKQVNAMAWGPVSSKTICTVGEDKKVFIWNLQGQVLNESTPTIKSPLLQYTCSAEVTNIAWNRLERIAVCSQNVVKLLLV